MEDVALFFPLRMFKSFVSNTFRPRTSVFLAPPPQDYKNLLKMQGYHYFFPNILIEFGTVNSDRFAVGSLVDFLSPPQL